MILLLYEMTDELEEGMTKTTDGILSVTLIGVFHAWRRRLEECIQNEGDSFE
jgi:hypothetical protein